MTEGGVYSLTEQTLQVVDQINVPVNFYGLWRPGDENQQLTGVIDLYLARNRNIRLEVVDPNRNPGLVSRFDRSNQGITQGSLVVEGEKGFKIISPMDMYDYYTTQSGSTNITGISMERRITAALLFVATGQTPVIYEISGHQEYSLYELNMQAIVERENFSVRQLNLIQSAIPEDASALLLNAPRTDLSQAEAEKILDYLGKGGRLIILVDYRTRELAMVNEVMASYGMRFDYGYLVENDYSRTAGVSYLAIPEILEHAITNPLIEQRIPVLLPFSMGITELSTKRRTVELTRLLSSSNDSFLRTDLEDESSARGSADIPGPITLAMTAMDPSWIQGNEPQARIVVIACGSLLEPINYYGQVPGNIDFFMNSITWLEDRPETLSVRSKSMFLLPMRVTGFQMILYGVIFVIVIPLGFFISGFVVWLRRRHL
jgi:hypothetical protein